MLSGSKATESPGSGWLESRHCRGVALALEVRLATKDDRDEVIRLVRSLLIELGGNPAPPEALLGVVDDLVSGSDTGFVVIGEEDGVAKAACTASFVTALRTVGRYVVLQEMFVEPESRSSAAWARRSSSLRLEHAAANGVRGGGTGYATQRLPGRSSSMSVRGSRISAPGCGGGRLATCIVRHLGTSSVSNKYLPHGDSSPRLTGSIPLRVEACDQVRTSTYSLIGKFHRNGYRNMEED